MTVTTSANGRTVVHRQSEGFSIAVADVCLALGIPIPFVNVALSLDAVATAASVFADGFAVMKASSHLGRSYGDEPGIDGGIFSHVNRGSARFIDYSEDVLVEGEPVPRALDPMVHNLAAGLEDDIANALSPALIQLLKELGGEWLTLIMCYLLCKCAKGGRGKCVARELADQVQGGYAWDPKYRGIWPEVSYHMNPPSIILTELYSNNQTDENHNPLPLPRGDYPAPHGSKRPDVVIAKNKDLPPAYGNVDKIYEFKFEGDEWRPSQREDYEKIAGAQNVIEISPENCPKCRALDVHVPRIPWKELEPYLPIPLPVIPIPEIAIPWWVLVPFVIPSWDPGSVLEPDPELGPTEENRREDEQHVPFRYPQYGEAEREYEDPPPPPPPDPEPPKPTPVPPPPPRDHASEGCDWPHGSGKWR